MLKTIFSISILIFIEPLFLGCNRKPEVFIINNISAEELATIFPNPAVDYNIISWDRKNPFGNKNFPDAQYRYDSMIYTRIDTVYYDHENEESNIYVVLETGEFSDASNLSCHACGPYTGIAVFKQLDNGKYKLKQFWPNLFSIGHFGKPALYRLLDLSIPILLVESYWMGMGEFYSSFHFFDLTNGSELFSYHFSENVHSASKSKKIDRKMDKINGNKVFLIKTTNEYDHSGNLLLSLEENEIIKISKSIFWGKISIEPDSIRAMRFY